MRRIIVTTLASLNSGDPELTLTRPQLFNRIDDELSSMTVGDPRISADESLSILGRNRETYPEAGLDFVESVIQVCSSSWLNPAADDDVVRFWGSSDARIWASWAEGQIYEACVSEARPALDQLEFEPDTPDPVAHPLRRFSSPSPPRRAASNIEDHVLRIERFTQTVISFLEH